MTELKEIILKRIDDLLITTDQIYQNRANGNACDENSYFKALYGTISHKTRFHRSVFQSIGLGY